jgi:hypothetical protein
MNAEKCLSCQFEEHKTKTGEWRNAREFRHFAMWGCTCDTEHAEDAVAFISAVTR